MDITTILLIALAITIIVHACVAYKRSKQKKHFIAQIIAENLQMTLTAIKNNRDHGIINNEEYYKQVGLLINSTRELIKNTCGDKYLQIAIQDKDVNTKEDIY